MKQMSWASANTFALRALWLAGSMAGSLMLAGPARADGGDAPDGVISPGQAPSAPSSRACGGCSSERCPPPGQETANSRRLTRLRCSKADRCSAGTVGSAPAIQRCAAATASAPRVDSPARS